jgi:hypothetical protein
MKKAKDKFIETVENKIHSLYNDMCKLRSTYDPFNLLNKKTQEELIVIYESLFRNKR